jgi:hypothetical protein
MAASKEEARILADRSKNAAKEVRAAALQKLADDKDEKAVLFFITVHKVGQIDAISQTFGAELGLHLYWFEPGLVGTKLEREIEYIDPEEKHSDGKPKVLLPTLHYENSVADKATVSEISPELRKEFPAGVVHWEERARGTFTELFELETFPFDVQTLSISMRINSKLDSLRKRYACDLHEYVKGKCDPAKYPNVQYANDFAVHVKESVRMAEWRIYKPTVDLSGAKAKKKDKEGKVVPREEFIKKCDTYCLNIILRRRHIYYSANVMAMMGCICTLGLTVYVVPVTDFVGRSSIVLTLMLTAVAFKFLVSGELPKVPYSTYLDTCTQRLAPARIHEPAWCFPPCPLLPITSPPPHTHT